MMVDWDDAYANAAHIDGAAEIIASWPRKASAFRAKHGKARQRLGVPYGDHPLEAFDLFLPQGAAKGCVVFIHGGYWQSMQRGFFSHLAAGPLARGWAVAMPGYRLCPQVRIKQITQAMARALGAVARQIPSGPVHLSGHSAGGHLAARLMCRDVPHEPEVAARIGRVVPISGVFDLRPLLRTKLRQTLRLDEAEAAAESPALCEPRPKTVLTCWAGAQERPEFRRQNALLANIWAGLDARCTAHEAPGRHHFSVIDDLCDPASALCAALLDEA